jgi:hypothetical protein
MGSSIVNTLPHKSTDARGKMKGQWLWVGKGLINPEYYKNGNQQTEQHGY